MTLLELMFAAGIVGMALAFLFGSLVTISLASNLTQNRAIVATHIATVMEELHGAGLQQLLTYTPPVFTGLGLGAAEIVQVEAVMDDGSVLALPVDPATVGPLPNPLLIRCRVNWIGAENRLLALDASQFFYR
jgi:type II secretory pathway pseudopilin PulG